MKYTHKIIVLALIYGGVQAYEKISPQFLIDDSPSTQISWSTGEPEKSEFHCDGRQYCSEMRSRKEAEYFTYFCPDTKMDGDRDGIPCENDSRW